MATEADAPKKILLFGATGVIGKYILQALVGAKSSFERIGIFTSRGTAEKKRNDIDALKAHGVDVIVGDINDEGDVKRAYEGFDTVISALGRNVILAQIPLLSLAETSPTIKHFYPSEYGTDIEYHASSVSEKPHQLKLQVRDHIRKSISKLNITYLVTGPYSDLYISKSEGDKARAGSFDASAKKAILLGTGKEQVSFTTMRDVGRLLVAALKTTSTTSPRTLKVNSFTTTPSDILAEFEKQTDAKWDVDYTSLDELKKLESEAWERGDPLATMYTLKRIWTEGGTLYDKRDNWQIGDSVTETLAEQVRQAVERQSAGV